MTLSDIVADLKSLDDELCIIAKRPWTGASEAHVVHLTDDFRVPAENLSAGFEYFLEVSVARGDVLDGIEHRLSAEQRLAAIIFYAENDAYPEWLCDLRS